ncbi:MAG: hypothetical protein JWP29_2999, partial [Rhodoferax sp.]|nr:hypothetical protein [Rhodoferax sp.]
MSQATGQAAGQEAGFAAITW